jgi:hypothetical protein
MNEFKFDDATFTEPTYPSWQSVLGKGEFLGGPTAHGNSWWQDFTRCPRRFYLAHVKRLRGEGANNALEIGGLMHEAAARYHTSGPAAAWELVDKAAEVTPVVALEVRRLLSAWLMHYGEAGLRPRPIARAVELELGVEVPFPYTTRVDNVSVVDGQVVIYEMKTAGRLTSDLLHGYELNSQFLGQKYLWKACGYDRTWGPLHGFVVDLVVKTKQVQLEEVHVEIPDVNVREWAKNMRVLWGQMGQCAAYGVWPQHLSNCVTYNRLCRFHRLCSSLGKDTAGLVRKARGEW